ncbi:MAG: DNA mismatch repair protein MutS [Candidatus Saganbacteria bacterium]|nr:DNA mismatch repair protein MutS [Candidatus Saganbacteria bacterium]
MSQETPMIRQYQEIKQKHQDAILFFRLGDFYEMFYDDALLASKELEITLTGRGHEENRMPMCGIPYHAADAYISKLIDKGHKVAICEQVEDPASAKGIVRREVIKIITPGTLLNTDMLSEKENNYLVALAFGKKSTGLAYIDISTGDFRITELDSKQKVLDEILRFGPKECLIPDIVDDEHQSIVSFLKANQVMISYYKDIYDYENVLRIIKDHFNLASLESFGIDNHHPALAAVAAILDYLSETQKTTLNHINSLKAYALDEFLKVDATTRRNLELLETVRDKSAIGSLLWVMDRTKTGMGARLLKQWIQQPSVKISEIDARLNAVEELVGDSLRRTSLGEALKNISDIERLTGKIATKTCNARDLVGLKESLIRLPEVTKLLKGYRGLLNVLANFPSITEVVELVGAAIVDQPPLTIKEGGIIKPGYDVSLDEIAFAAKDGKSWIANLEFEERKRTGIKSLKVGFTRVFGYYIEISHANHHLVPLDYIRKQTLVNAERYITPDMKEKETLILNADERMKAREYEIFCEVRDQVGCFVASLKEIATALSEIDVLLSFADVAVDSNYVKPKISDSMVVRLKNSRHPVVEKTLGEHNFVPNNVLLDDKENMFLLITGPNMGGKSTFLRQTALICLMAQMGSFVPAEEAEIGVVDRIFTRIGAMDDIFSGQSTFMVEMIETANILNNATDRSLVILDEIGRGTATFDGMSIAAAVVEYLHTKVKAKTMFATHYHEITGLANKYPGIKNLNVLIKDSKDTITFLHKIAEGSADKSYGIQVAKLAGLPAEVVERAKDVYKTLEMVENDFQTPQKRVKIQSKDQGKNQISLF